jgi:PASTA domain/Papain family cysteine protease
VRLEVATAVRRNIRVIPVLVEGAALPAKADLPADCQPILDRNARELRDVSWGTDVDLLVQSIEKSVKRPTPVERYVRAVSPRILIAAAVVVLAIAGLAVWVKTVRVPNVVGLPIDQARQTIQSAKISVLKEERAPNPGRAGVVLNQNPQPGRRWKTGVNLVVSEREPVDLSKFVRIRQQGSEGTGPAFAVAAAMDASLAAQGASVVVSPRYLYAKARLRDKLPAAQEGANPATVLAVAADSGAPTEQEWPYQAGNGQLPAGVTWAALDRLAMKHRAIVTPVGSIAEIYDYLKRQQPVVGVVFGTDTWLKPEIKKTGRVEIVANPNPEASHFVAFVDFDPMSGTLRFANSWGPEWGDHGFGSMSTDVAEKMIDTSQMWAVDAHVDR